MLLVDLDDTLIPDRAARDSALTSTLATFCSLPDLSPIDSRVWPVVREEWRADGLRLVPAMAGVSSWEACGLTSTLRSPIRSSGGREGLSVSGVAAAAARGDAAAAGAVFRQAREELVGPFRWVDEGLAGWGGGA